MKVAVQMTAYVQNPTFGSELLTQRTLNSPSQPRGEGEFITNIFISESVDSMKYPCNKTGLLYCVYGFISHNLSMKIAPFKVEDWMNEYEKYSKYDLGNTTVQTLSVDELFELTGENKQQFFNNLFKQKLGYAHIKGLPAFKEGVKNLYNTVEPDNIIPTIGAAGANHLVFYSLVEPADRVISVIPTYQQLYSIPESFGADVQYLRLTPENRFLPDLKELKTLVNKKTKLICINNPNNPTGALISGKMLEEIIEIAKSVNAYILSDEVYRGLNIAEEYTPSVADLYEKGVSVCSMSKIFSLAGLRLGWIACKDREFIEKCISHREYNMISCSLLDENIAALALKHYDKIIERNKTAIKQCAALLDNWVKQQKHISYVKPYAGTTALLYYDFDMTSKELCDRLAKEKGVFLTPGFCFETEHCFRVGYCKNPEMLKQGLEKISDFIQESEKVK